MPLANGAGAIAGSLNLFRPGMDVTPQRLDAGNMLQLAELRISSKSGSNIENFMSRCVLTREQASTSRRAVGRCRVSIRKDHALCSEPIEVWRLVKIGSHESTIAPTEVVQKDEQDVRTL